MKIKDSDLTLKAYNHFINLLNERKLQPGNLISPKDYARELQISLSPVHKAMHRLALEGLLIVLPRKGTFVANANPEALLDQMFLREAIECQAARIYCGKPVSENIETIRELANDIENTSENSPDHWRKEIAFHSFLVSLSQSQNLQKIFANNIQFGFFLTINMYFDELTKKQGHFEMAKRLTTSNPDEAEKIMRDHLRSGKPKYLQNLHILGEKTWNEI